MHSAEMQEACLFLNHLSVMIACRFYERLKNNNMRNAYAPFLLGAAVPATIWPTSATIQ